MSGGFHDAAHLEAERREHEAGLLEEAGEEVVARRGAIDFADEQAAAATLPPDGDLGELAGELAREAGELGLVLRQEYADFRIAAAQKRRELADRKSTRLNSRHAN